MKSIFTNTCSNTVHLFVGLGVAWLAMQNDLALAITLSDTKSSPRAYTLQQKHISFETISSQLSVYQFRCSYRMSKATFNKLLIVLGSFLPPGNTAINGRISKATQLRIAVRYLLGGNPYNIMMLHGVGHITVFDSLWSVICAVHECCPMDICWPQFYAEQYKNAEEFKSCS